jgi:bifunctional lysine-specific demethylase and histidyl-hydroxylase NO66
VLDLFAGGATIVLQSLQRWWPPAGRFCRDLELALGHAIQANAYLTPAGAAGLAPHHDTHDVFVLQVAGTKHWVVREPAVVTPLPRQISDHTAAAAQPVLFETDMGPGEALYLPRGYVHSAAAQAGVSLHITVGVLATTVTDVLQRLVELAGDEPAFRRSLAPGWPFDEAAATAAVKAAVADLAAWLEQVDPAEVASGMRERWTASRTPALEGLLHEIAGLDRIGDDTTVVRREGTLALLADDDGAGAGALGGGDTAPGPPAARARLTLGDREVVLPAALAPAVRRLVDGTPRRVGDLADLLDAPSRLVLVRRLVREGALCTRAPATDG